MNPIVQTLAITLLTILIAMLLLWIVSLWRRDASVVDPFWGFGFVLTAWIALVVNTPGVTRVLMLVGLTTIWGLRLSLFLLWRNWGHGEDRRYAAMRNHHGPRFWWISLFTVFLLQGVILWFVSFPIQVAAAKSTDTPLDWLDWVGVAVWGLGLFFEAVGDFQLAQFKAQPNNAGKVLDSGLWKYTRHPNYFGDFCIWWGLYLIAAAGGAGSTILSPLLMSCLLLWVSGVRLTESTMANRRPEYLAYQRSTNAFFPGPRFHT